MMQWFLCRSAWIRHMDEPTDDDLMIGLSLLDDCFFHCCGFIRVLTLLTEVALALK